MQDNLERLLRTVESPDWESIQSRWEEYRTGADSQDSNAKASADSAFASLLAWYGSALYRHIWGFVRSDAAEDIFQDVLRKLHEKRLDSRLASFHANVLPWLRTVAIRQCVDSHRRSARRRARESRVARPIDVAPSEPPGEVSELLVVALSRLPTKLQQAVAVHYFEGLDRKQAAAALGIHRDTLAVRLDDALRRLRKQLASPAALVIGSELALTAALASIPTGPPAQRLTDLAARAWQNATPAWGLKNLVAPLLIGIALSGAVAAGWAISREPQDTPSPAGAIAAVPQLESLQQKNERITRDEIVPILLRESQKLAPADNPLKLMRIRAFGSEVECEFQLERPVAPAWKPLGLRVRYCTLMRRIEIDADIRGDGAWKSINPERPIILDLAIPGLPIPTADFARSSADAARTAFERLPVDDRAETEQVGHLFATASGAFVLPAGLRGLSASDGNLFAVLSNSATYCRNPAGRWSYLGECPGWWMIAQGKRLFCIRGDEIWLKPSLERNVDWVTWSRLPKLRADEKYEFLAIAGDRLFVIIQPGGLVSCSLTDSELKWVREADSTPIWPYGFAGTADRLFGQNTRQILSRRAGGREWTLFAPWPERGHYIVIDGDRMLACGGDPGPILSRSLSATYEAEWDVIGQVQAPRR